MNNIDFVLSLINEHWQSGKKILEVGCGPAFLRKHYGADYTGSDITDENYTPTLPRDVDVVCPADDLKFSDNSFDIVLIKSAFFLFDDHNKALSEARRVLCDNGVILILDYNMRTQKRLQKGEGHNRYPCWTQWGLQNLITNSGFKSPKLWIGDKTQPVWYKRPYHLLRQELLGTWAIVSASK